jgi:hypothetical protein
VHSVVSQGVIASYAPKLKVHAVCERAASGQLLFLGLSHITTLGSQKSVVSLFSLFFCFCNRRNLSLACPAM